MINSKLLIEWLDANGNKISYNMPTSKLTANSKAADVVYIWDMWMDPADKGTWCSAEKYHGEYDGLVFENRNEAYHAGADHLYELDVEGELRGDPIDYTIDVLAIPRAEVSDYTLEFSGL